MKDITKYQGIIPAFYACYSDNGAVDTTRVRALVRYMIKKGVKGVYVNGSSGECIYLTVAERKAILEAVMDEAKGKLTVICHIACNNTADSMELAAHAEKCGVDAIASIPPIYFHLPEYAIAKYWNDMSAAAPNTEFVIYNIPQLAGTALSMSLLGEMLKNPNVIAVKNSSMPVQDIQLFKAAGIAARGKDGFVVFNGPDEQFISGRIMGADGGIGGTYAAMPELLLKANELLAANRLAEAQALQYDINEIIYALCGCKGNMYATIKEVLRRREGLDLGGVRAPLFDLVPEDMPQVEKCCAMIDAAIQKYC
ncbi:MAG: dihydrodipicolinate synthase family protein [Gemmiger sp.]|nr:dihydrodipicolinate synthase family protein [Gemmiger sp.]